MIAALAGGVGGAKLAHGLYSALAPDSLTVVVNTGDDFDLYGLHIMPDADTVLYTLAGIANPETGWGVAGGGPGGLEVLGASGEERWCPAGDWGFRTPPRRAPRLPGGS